MENIIILEFSNTITRLAGNPYGQEIYLNQVKDNVDFNALNIIVIPEHIKDIAISFVQGFGEQAFKKIDKNDFYNYFRIEGNQKVVNNFNKYIFF